MSFTYRLSFLFNIALVSPNTLQMHRVKAAECSISIYVCVYAEWNGYSM